VFWQIDYFQSSNAFGCIASVVLVQIIDASYSLFHSNHALDELFIS
jgi:hypothetical protein